MQRLLFFIISLFVLSAAVAEKQNEAWNGVWEGKIGAYPVRVCLQNDIDGQYVTEGAYYYMHYLKIIILRSRSNAGSNNMHLSFNESNERDSPQWRLDLPAENMLAGVWRDQHKTLPIVLNRIIKKAHGCGTDEFNLPRQEADQQTWEMPQKYLKSTQRIPMEDLKVTTFRLPKTHPHAEVMNLLLEKYEADWHKEGYECMRNTLGPHADRGNYSRRLSPILITTHWLTAEDNSEIYCAEPPVNIASDLLVWNLDSNRQVNPWTWFNSSAVMVRAGAQGAPVNLEGGVINVALREIIARALTPDKRNCADYVNIADWFPAPSKNGMIFRPHSGTECDGDIVINYKQLQPMLNATGKAAVESILTDSTE